MIRSVISVLLIAATVVAIRGADLYVKRNMLNEDYMDYDRYRGMYQDYKKPGFNENQELYNSVGWDENVYNLAANLIYIDPAINEHKADMDKNGILNINDVVLIINELLSNP